MIADARFKFGAGSGLVYNMIVAIYSDVEIDLSATVSNAKTQVKEKYERVGIITPKLGEKVPEDVLEDEQGNVTFTITMPQKGIVLLKTLGNNVPLV